MKKTLILSYTPRDNSNTKKMLDFFIENNQNKTEITFVDLAEEAPDLLLKENLNLYVNRNFGGVALTDEQQKILAKNDKMMQQLLDTDYVVLASPMYNFSIPATVKAWFDAVIQAGKTFGYTETGVQGFCKNTKALILMTSGSDFGMEPYKSVNFATPFLITAFDFLGIPAEAINKFGMIQYADKSEQMIADAKEEIKNVSDKWY
ncbi:NAD(P)H-dependent oxidoreductase [Polaribacter sp. Z014]|uniref:FMN-dependent NADH-azoreductase n=1 Tax=unclassified Polaribacter TaxID=196858 RepID=UPI00193AFBC7|nr:MULTISPECIES: NAD(P)H-dependent oxidoreductase [unclassified Polaribacter]MCL7764679.1 NAD(P)H-dependent oxidoreductase [Polaribacter sp. Z014]QVY65875.1 NAD(P)H-dependent oxidoreductase [Polaribacter sp. Q13]